MNGQQSSSTGLLRVPGTHHVVPHHHSKSDIRRPQARRSSAVAIVFTRGESISLERATAARRMSRKMSVNRDFKFKSNPWNTFLGDCSVVHAYLNDKPRDKPQWAVLHFLNNFFRTVGQPAFVNNPLCGAIIFASFFVKDVMAGVGALMGCAIAVIANMILGLHPWATVRNGVASFNGMLVGLVGSALFPVFYNLDERPVELWGFLAVGALVSIYVSKALHRFLGGMNVPFMAIPFNMIITCIFLALKPEQDDAVVVEAEAEQEIDWLMVARGVLVSMSQVWGIDDPVTGGVIGLAMLLFSPLLTLVCFAGAAFGTGLGLLILPAAQLGEIYSGVWGFNTLLTLGGTACVFYPLTPQSALLAVATSAAAFCVQMAIRVNMTLQNGIPTFTWPQVLTMVVLTMVTSEEDSGWLKRMELEDISYPEKQFMNWYRRDRLKLTKVSMDEEIPEEDEDDYQDGRTGNNSLGDNIVVPYVDAEEDEKNERSSNSGSDKRSDDVKL